jgi:hypothetical protein
LIGVAVSGYLAFSFSPWYSMAGVALLVVWLPIGAAHEKKHRESRLEAFEKSFETFAGSKPRYEEGSSYSFRTFTLTFVSKDEMKKAEETGHLRDFKTAIQALCGHTGSKSRPFDAEWAVHATYEGRTY